MNDKPIGWLISTGFISRYHTKLNNVSNSKKEFVFNNVLKALFHKQVVINKRI